MLFQSGVPEWHSEELSCVERPQRLRLRRACDDKYDQGINDNHDANDCLIDK